MLLLLLAGGNDGTYRSGVLHVKAVQLAMLHYKTKDSHVEDSLFFLISSQFLCV